MNNQLFALVELEKHMTLKKTLDLQMPTCPQHMPNDPSVSQTFTLPASEAIAECLLVRLGNNLEFMPSEPQLPNGLPEQTIQCRC